MDVGVAGLWVAVASLVATIVVHVASVRRDDSIRRDTARSERQRREHEARQERIDRVVRDYKYKISPGGERAGTSVTTVMDAGIRSVADDEEVREVLERIRTECHMDPMMGEIDKFAGVNLHTLFNYAHGRAYIQNPGSLIALMRKMDNEGVDYRKR